MTVRSRSVSCVRRYQESIGEFRSDSDFVMDNREQRVICAVLPVVGLKRTRDPPRSADYESGSKAPPNRPLWDWAGDLLNGMQIVRHVLRTTITAYGRFASAFASMPPGLWEPRDRGRRSTRICRLFIVRLERPLGGEHPRAHAPRARCRYGQPTPGLFGRHTPRCRGAAGW
jgi:hypothetical protein